MTTALHRQSTRRVHRCARHFLALSVCHRSGSGPRDDVRRGKRIRGIRCPLRFNHRRITSVYVKVIIECNGTVRGGHAIGTPYKITRFQGVSRGKKIRCIAVGRRRHGRLLIFYNGITRTGIIDIFEPPPNYCARSAHHKTLGDRLSRI